MTGASTGTAARSEGNFKRIGWGVNPGSRQPRRRPFRSHIHTSTSPPTTVSMHEQVRKTHSVSNGSMRQVLTLYSSVWEPRFKKIDSGTQEGHPGSSGVVFGATADLSGRVPRIGPTWLIERHEWVSRLLADPKRLWCRYLIGNSLFLHRIYRQRRRANT